MANNNGTYSFKGVADMRQHDQSLKKSASEVYKYRKSVDNAKVSIGKMASKFGPLAAQIGLAGGALATLDKAFRSTEAGADALDRSLYTAKSSVNTFFKSLTSGNFDSFITGLSDIVSTAKEAYNALDDLGTMKMWKNARIEQLKAQIAEDRVTVNNANASGSDRQAAQQRIALNMEKIQALTGDIVEQTMKAATAKLREIAGTSKVSDAQLNKYLSMWESGTLGSHYADFASQHSHKETVQSSGRGGMNAGFVYTTTQTKWDSEDNRILAAAMASILNTNEQELQQYYDLLTQAAQLQQTTANQQNKANQLTNKNGGSGSGKSGGYEIGSIADVEAQIKALQDRLKNEALSGNEAQAIQKQIDLLEYKKQVIEESRQPLERMAAAIETMPTLDASIIDGEAIAAELQQVIDGLEQVGLTMDELKDLEAVGDSFGYIGDMFSSLSDVVGDESGKVFEAVGNSISAIAQAIAKISALMMAEGAASVMDLPYPANLAALASVIAAATGVIGSISGIASQSFADGGIFQGAHGIGDYNLARVNSGEMILNGTQQSRLFRLLNNPTITTTTPDGGNVTFRISGSDLVGTLDNYQRQRRRAL